MWKVRIQENIDLKSITFEQLGNILTNVFPYIPFEETLNNQGRKEYIYTEGKNSLRLHIGKFDSNIHDGCQYISLTFAKHLEGQSAPFVDYEELIEEVKSYTPHFDVNKNFQTSIFDFLEFDEEDLQL